MVFKIFPINMCGTFLVMIIFYHTFLVSPMQKTEEDVRITVVKQNIQFVNSNASNKKIVSN